MDIQKWVKPRKRTWQEDRRILDKDILPDLGILRLGGAVKRHDIIALADEIASWGPIRVNSMNLYKVTVATPWNG